MSSPSDSTNSEPLPGTYQSWAWKYIHTKDLAEKRTPPPSGLCWQESPSALRIAEPGRPPCLQLLDKAPKSVSRNALQHPARRAQQFHTFWHHELQAAELMAWAVLAFPQAPRAFLRGLIQIAEDEIRHMKLYEKHLNHLGYAIGDFPVRDWFWLRVPTVKTPAEYVAVMGMGLEGGNLDHADRFSQWFSEVGDHQGSAIQRLVCTEEVAHVRFGVHWFREFTGGDSFASWCRHLPPKISPLMLHGPTINTTDRLRAGLSADFVQQLSEC